MNDKDQQIKSEKKKDEFLHSETNTEMKCTVVTYLFFYSHSIKVLRDKHVLP